MKKLLFFVLICGVMSSCHGFFLFEKEHNYIPSEDIPLLNNDEIINFKDSVTQKIDSYRIEKKIIWSETNESFLQFIEIYYNKTNSNDVFFFLNLSKMIADVIPINIWLSNIDEGYYLGDYNKVVNLKFNNITYSKLYVIQNRVTQSLDTVPKTVYYSLNKGIIRYEYKDGRVYNLVSK